MAYKVVINGFGRVGRNVLRAYLERSLSNSDPGSKGLDVQEFEIVAVNDIASAPVLAHLFQFDSTHGILPWSVECVPGSALAPYDIQVQGMNIPIFQCGDARDLPWDSLQVDLVIECSGCYRYRHLAEQHVEAGAHRVVISAPALDAVDGTVVYGVNEGQINSGYRIFSAASCTTNALANIIKPLHDRFGVISGLVTEIHGYTSDQVLLDSAHCDLRRARSAPQSLIPTTTLGIETLGQVLPEMQSRISGYSMRVPTVNVAAIDANLILDQFATVGEINDCIKAASESLINSVLAYNKLPLVSRDFNHHPASAIFDATQTQVVGGGLVKVVAWYDNEWGYANRLLDIAVHMTGF